MPESALSLARQTAEREGRDGWLLTLEFPSYYPVLTYADNRELRAELYEAYVTRASDAGPCACTWDRSIESSSRTNFISVGLTRTRFSPDP